MTALAQKAPARWRRLRVLTDRYQAEPALPFLFLSHNDKTGLSINLPIVGTCRPTRACRSYCYGLGGPIAFPFAIRRERQNLDRLVVLESAPLQDVEREADFLAFRVQQAEQDFLRINGVGDLVLGMVRLLPVVADRHGWLHLWVSTRRLDMVELLPVKQNLHIMLSCDRTTPCSQMDRMRQLIVERGPTYYLAYVSMGPDDRAPDDVTIVFNYHAGGIRTDSGDPRACGATVPGGDAHKGACAPCGRCWSLQKRQAF